LALGCQGAAGRACGAAKRVARNTCLGTAKAGQRRARDQQTLASRKASALPTQEEEVQEEVLVLVRAVPVAGRRKRPVDAVQRRLLPCRQRARLAAEVGQHDGAAGGQDAAQLGDEAAVEFERGARRVANTL
jgi:hypothetical protein